MKGDEPPIWGRPFEFSVNNEASSRVGNGVLFLAARFLQYRLMANPSDKRKSSPTLLPMAATNGPTLVRELSLGWLERKWFQ